MVSLGDTRPIDPAETARRIRESSLDIYTPVEEMPPGLVFERGALEARLDDVLRGKVFPGPVKSRSKKVKEAVCEALGFPVPKSFARTQPRLPAQDLDVFAQQSNNLQIWNEEVSPTRRYALLRIDGNDRVTKVKVLDGMEVAALDTTGTLTHKFQARRRTDSFGSLLVTEADTAPFSDRLEPRHQIHADFLRALDPAQAPARGSTLTIRALFEELTTLVGHSFPDCASDRLRGEAFHRAVCDRLGLGAFRDSGKFPDVTCQALEVKLQTSPTIDLGLVDPASAEPAITVSPHLSHRDCRFLIGYATIDAGLVTVDSVVVTTGAGFFGEFVRFGGLIKNKKLQIKLPDSLFS